MSYSYDSMQAADTAMQVLERRWRPAETPTDPNTHWGISLGLGFFCAGMDVILRELKRQHGVASLYELEHRPTFLDVGCGIGTKLVMANAYGFLAHGIDVFEPYVGAANEMLPGSAMLMDAFALTDGYENADVVYMSKPRRDTEQDATQQDALDRHVASHMRPGALAFFVGTGNQPEGSEALGQSVFRVHAAELSLP